MLQKEGIRRIRVEGFLHLILQIIPLLLAQISAVAHHSAANNSAWLFQLEKVLQPLFSGKIRLLDKQVHQMIHINGHRLCQTALDAFLLAPASLTLREPFCNLCQNHLNLVTVHRLHNIIGSLIF